MNLSSVIQLVNGDSPPASHGGHRAAHTLNHQGPVVSPGSLQLLCEKRGSPGLAAPKLVVLGCVASGCQGGTHFLWHVPLPGPQNSPCDWPLC